jgi:hypothetical protein
MDAHDRVAFALIVLFAFACWRLAAGGELDELAPPSPDVALEQALRPSE